MNQHGHCYSSLSLHCSTICWVIMGICRMDMVDRTSLVAYCCCCCHLLQFPWSTNFPQPLAWPSLIYGDNMSVIHNTQKPESVLIKKSNQICYHEIKESIAMGECLTGHVASKENPTDLATKLILGGQTRYYLIGKLLFDICDYWWSERFPTSSSVCQFEGYLRFPVVREHDKYSWVGLDPYFFYIFIFIFFHDLAIFISACTHFGWVHEGTVQILPCWVPWPEWQAKTYGWLLTTKPIHGWGGISTHES